MARPCASTRRGLGLSGDGSVGPVRYNYSHLGTVRGVREAVALEMDGVARERRSTTPVVPPARPRKLAKVPFVELSEGRLQGVVSSGSDIERVYVSSIT